MTKEIWVLFGLSSLLYCWRLLASFREANRMKHAIQLKEGLKEGTKKKLQDLHLVLMLLLRCLKKFPLYNQNHFAKMKLRCGEMSSFLYR